MSDAHQSAPASGPAAATPSVGDVLFGRPAARPPRPFLAIGVIFAVVLHGTLWLWALDLQPSLESWSATLAARVHAELTRQEVVEMDKPANPPPPPAPTPPPPAATATRKAARSRPAATSAPAPPAPAQAARAVVAEPRADTPVDLTNELVTGTANVYAGGTTRRSGTSPTAVAPGPATDGSGTAEGPPHGKGPDRSSSVSLVADEWQCAWPREADAQDIDQQWVVLRVIVRADGSAESARLVSDPGHGFGAAAVACALRTRFVAARDGDGQPRRAESPPIRVRFTR